MGHLLRLWNYAERFGTGAPENLAVVPEYPVAEVLELAGNAALECKKTRVILCHLISNFGHFPRYHHLSLVKIGQQRSFIKAQKIISYHIIPSYYG